MATLQLKTQGQSSGSLPIVALERPQFLTVSPGASRVHLAAEKTKDYKAVLIEFLGRWLLFTRVGQRVLRVNSVAVVGVKVLRHGDVIEFEDFSLIFSDEALESVGTESPLLSKRCPYCKSRFQAGDQAVRCPRCSLAHHARCWQIAGCGSNPPCGWLRTSGPAAEDPAPASQQGAGS